MKQSNISEKQKLRFLLKSHAKKISDEVIQTDGQLSDPSLKELAAIEKLIEILEHTEPPPPRWPVITIVIITLVIVSVLLFARVSSTEINLNISLSEVNFRLSKQQVISKAIRLTSLGISGLKEIEFPETDTGEGGVDNSDGGSSTAIRLEKDTSYKSGGSLTLSPLLLQSKANIWIGQGSETPEECNLLVRDSLLVIKADVFGMIQTGEPGIPSRQINFSIPKSFVLRSGANDVDLTIKPLYDKKNIFKKQIFIDSLSFFHIDEYVDEEYTVLQRVSSIKSGTLYFESLGGMEYTLHPGEEIKFNKLKGYINNLELWNDHVSFTFRGIARGMTTGGKENRISLMPTYLDWLKARHSLSLLWGTTIYFLGFLISLIRWWKTTK